MSDASNPFEAPTKLSNVVLIVEGKKLHVSKELLATHSPVFEAMFFGEFAEKDKEEIEIKDVAYEEFVDLLKTIHPDWEPISVNSIDHIVKLADQFQIKSALIQSENFLLCSQFGTNTKKLLMADQYNLQKLKDQLFNSFRCVTELCNLQSDANFASLSLAMRSLILDKIMDLSHGCKCKAHKK